MIVLKNDIIQTADPSIPELSGDSDMDKYAEIKADADALCANIRKYLPEVEISTVQGYCLAAILRTWGSNLSYAPDYASVISIIANEKYTTEQIITAMGCCGDPEHRLQSPEFVKRIVELDAGDGGTRTAEILEGLNGLLVSAAMINDDFTTEEATAVAQIVGGLVQYAKGSGVSAPSPDNMPRITGRNESSYLQNDALLAAARQRTTGSVEAGDAPGADREKPNVIVNINISAEDRHRRLSLQGGQIRCL